MAHPNSKRAKAAKAKRAKDRSGSSAEDKSQADDRRAERTEKRDEVRRRQNKQASLRKARNGAIAAAVGLLVGFGLWNAFKPGPELAGVEKVSNQGRGHVENATYSDPAPTSGDHAASGTGCGVFPSQLPADLAVHALEHGTVVIWYSTDRPELAGELAALLSEYSSHVIVSPNSGIDSPIVATAWNRRKSYETVTDDLRDFVDIYRQRGPESVPCDL